MCCIREKLMIIEDSYHLGYVEHNLADVLIIIMCGLEGLAEIMFYAGNKVAFVKEKFGIEQIPSKVAVSRILNMVDGRRSIKSNHRNHDGKS